MPRALANLCKALHGTPPAAASWGDELGQRLVGCGASVVTLILLVEQCNGCDIFSAGPRERVLKIGALLKERWETRDQAIGLKPCDLEEHHILNRTVRWCRDGLVFAADVKHAKEVIEEFESASSKLLSSPVAVDNSLLPPSVTCKQRKVFGGT